MNLRREERWDGRKKRRKKRRKERRKKDERKLNLFRVENKYMKVTC